MKNSDEKKPDINVFSYKFLTRAKLSYLITMPFILMMVIPTVLLDICVTVYQAVNFTAYNIPKVKRSDYVVIDRHSLHYLNFMEKFFCLYCGYVNGVMQYASEIGVRTEEFWCPIKHKKKIGYKHSRYKNYLEYGDSTAYHAKRKSIRLQMKKDLKDSI